MALKTTFGEGSKTVSIDNAVLGTLPKHLLFTELRNIDFTVSVNTNPFLFKYFGLNHFVMYVDGRQVPSEGLTIINGSAKTYTMTYQSFLNVLGIHHGKSASTQFMKGSFMHVFNLTPDGCVSDGHTIPPENGSISIELKLDEALVEAVTIVLYQEFDDCIQIDRLKKVTTDF